MIGQSDPQTLPQASTVLIVDDIEDNIALLSRYLQRHGHQTQECRSGSEAIAMISQARPMLVLLDWMMPGLSGLDTLHAIRELYDEEALPVIMCTAIEDEISMVNALRGGANDYITKPINLPVLLARVETQVNRMHKVQGLNADKMKLEKALSQRTAALLRASQYRPGESEA